MNSDRQRQVTSIFHSAIEREGTERRAFLDGDDALRREVEELIESHESAGSLYRVAGLRVVGGRRIQNRER